MVAPKDGTHNIQRSSDNQYLAIIGGQASTSPDAYKWEITGTKDDYFYIKDIVTASYLYDNGVNGYLFKDIQNANTQWQNLSSGPATTIYNKATGKPLLVPYAQGEAKWTVVKP